MKMEGSSGQDSVRTLVLKWVFDRVDGNSDVVETPIGLLPADGALDTTGLDIDSADLEAILSVDVDGWKSAIPEIREHLSRFEPRLPDALPAAVDRLESALA